MREENNAAPAAVAVPSEFPHEQMDAMALARYKVVPSTSSMIWSHAVVAVDGAQQLYVGREVECQNMVRKFAGAFLDGAFAFHSIAAAPTVQAAPRQEPVAWRHSKTLCLYETKAEVPLADGDEWAEPLYLAAPQPAPVAQGDAEDAERLKEIARAILDYHFALDTRRHGGVAQGKAFAAICQIMGMHWVQGAEAASRAAQKVGA